MDRDNASTATQAGPRMSRRGVMRTTAVGIGAAAGVGALGSSAAPVAAVDWKDVGTIAATTVIGGPIGLGWALRETGVLGSDSPPEGLTADALRQQVYQTAKTRKSQNASTIVDNENIIKGVEDTAYTDGKIAAIEELNAGSSESAVLDAATQAANSYFATIERNMLKSWNESVAELKNMLSAFASHPDYNENDIWGFTNTSGSNQEPYNNMQISNWLDFKDVDETLADGSTLTVPRVGFTYEGSTAGGDHYWSPTGLNAPRDDGGPRQDLIRMVIAGPDGGFVDYMRDETWVSVWNSLQNVVENVNNGLSTWVTNVYGQVQSGDIEISSLITPSVRADMLSDEETQASAIADLAALNIPIDPEREATITVTETSATLSGTIGLTDTSDGPIESGNAYDPSTFAGDVYFTADVSQLSGSWSGFNTGVDGGTITLTSKPYEGTVYNVTTTAGETVSVPASDWTDNGDGTWSYDASGELDTNITEVDSISYGSADDQTQYETLQISKEFTVDKLENTETGEEVTSTSFESSEPQTDSNYITQDEWNQLEQQNKELIEKYEKSQTTSGGAGGFLGGGLFEDTKTLGIVAGGAALAALLFGNN